MTLNFENMSINELFGFINSAQQEINKRRTTRAKEMQEELCVLISTIQDWGFHLDMSDMCEQHFSLDPNDLLYINISP